MTGAGAGRPSAGNLFSGLPARAPEERLDDLLTRPGVRIERIVSTGQASPPGFWYEQDWDEWVVLLGGRAGLLVESGEEVSLTPGDYLFLPAGKRHRVTWTDSEGATVWLAVHIGEKSAPA